MLGKDDTSSIIFSGILALKGFFSSDNAIKSPSITTHDKILL
jgi:hypothetical protein